MGRAKDPLPRAEVPGKYRPFAEPRLHEADSIRYSVILCPVRGEIGIFKHASVTLVLKHLLRLVLIDQCIRIQNTSLQLLFSTVEASARIFLLGSSWGPGFVLDP